MDKRINTIVTTIQNRILNSNAKTIDFEDILIGKLGLAQTCYQLYKNQNDERYLSKIEEILENIFDDMNTGKSSLTEKPSLADGIPGLGLVINQLIQGGILDDSYSEQVQMISDTVYTKCLDAVSKGNFDYFYGAIGLLFYLQEVNAQTYVENLIDVIFDYAEKNDFLFYNQVDDLYSQGINFGFAHGSLAIIAVFLEIYNKGIQQVKAKELILKTTDALLQFKRDIMDPSGITIMHDGYDYPSIFPYNVISEKGTVIDPTSKSTIVHYTDRLGWCNSDLSRMYLLYKVGTTFNENKYIQIANEMIDEVSMRVAIEDTAISDCYMCHGTSGVAHIYKKIYDLTGEPIFHKTYTYWLEQTVNVMEEELEKQPSDKDLELLTGWLGPLFVLSDYNGQESAGWDRVFLLN
ncbi:lanthionine synthetase LanC family protein [uncultured Dokdonia sp.]|uniref:lanthionine synthetase LanC family protein n=1 Tax=uncultured Dokdonia sp. TaxID=575653 RepID=UPI0026295BA2|nr:lanthionine synthetase LanC family protein [uncultured Dokdonia sp.]